MSNKSKRDPIHENHSNNHLTNDEESSNRFDEKGEARNDGEINRDTKTDDKYSSYKSDRKREYDSRSYKYDDANNGDNYRSSKSHRDRYREMNPKYRDDRNYKSRESRNYSRSPSRDRRRSNRRSDRSKSRERNKDRNKDRPLENTNQGSKNTDEDKNIAPEVEPPKRKLVPISVEDLIMQKKNSEEQLKPVFLSKEERQRLAIEKRKNMVEKQKLVQKAELEQTQKILKIFESGNKQNSRSDYSRSKSRYRRRSSSRSASPTISREESRKLDMEKRSKEMEMKAIRERYIGGEKIKRKVRKMNDKNFVFDWDAKEDTSQDYNSIYNSRHEPQFFGRGHIAGFDVKEQMAKKSRFYSQLLSERRTKEEISRAKELENIIRKKEAKTKWDDRHWSEKPLAEMKERDWRIFKEDFNISCKGGSIPNPIRSWDETDLPKDIKSVIKKVGYDKPTPIQRQAIPIGLQNRDIIGVAETGSGKTASFLIPMLVYIIGLPKINETNMQDGPYAIILAPTRELALQIEQETLKFSKLLNFTCVSIVGGHSIDEQAFALRNGAEIIIATPGRLKDCIDRRIIVLNQTTYIVMDEADRMIDMGFEEDVNFILDALPSTHLKPDSQDAEDASKMLQSQSGSSLRYRQTTMFSATMPPLVERLARKYLRRPAIVTIGTAGQAVDTVLQKVEFIASIERKRLRLVELLSEDYNPPVIIFVNLKKTADSLSKLLSSDGHISVVLHGGKSQEQREAALAKLKSGDADLLIATDVAGRGIDVKDVSLVINFDMAKSIEDYTHRIGRTGRAGKQGVAISFLTNEDSDVFYDLRKMIEKSSISKCPMELIQHEASQAPPGVIRTKRRYEETLYKE
ncbi:putative ATP-dependent RNA helicase DDX23 [Smittium culicis]|uniref:RNA helicase n=1 Tax=Smittium culicis TaxID=133412 RepID=A0A1R1YBV3_9FUNG|nr:putative ATP-dependent RNA helicase DDX23 [Smittium culicis]